MQQWGYITEIPPGQGGTRTHQVGTIVKCERCTQPFTVTAEPRQDECTYHWGKPYNKSLNGRFIIHSPTIGHSIFVLGEKKRIYTCCSRPIDEGGGCVQGPHVFYDSNPDDLHARHPFSSSRPVPPDADTEKVTSDTALDVVALDCEMVYTTGGMRVARVSVVDGAGTEVLDEFVQMDEGVVVT